MSLRLAAPLQDPPPVFPNKQSALGVRGRLAETEPVPRKSPDSPFSELGLDVICASCLSGVGEGREGEGGHNHKRRRWVREKISPPGRLFFFQSRKGDEALQRKKRARRRCFRRCLESG